MNRENVKKSPLSFYEGGKMKRKNTYILLIFTVLISILLFSYFVTGFYSVDTVRIYTQGYTDYATKDAYIRDGRLFSALIFVIIGIFNPSINIMYIINIFIAIIILSICVIQIYNIIKKYKQPQKRIHKAIAFMISYTYIFNFLLVDIMKYIDSFVISTSILLYILAIKKIIIDKQNKTGILLTILGVICYQGTIPVYIATAILITLLDNKTINKQFFKKILPCAISIIIGAVLSVIIVNLVPVITKMEKTERLEENLYIEIILQNLINMPEMILQTFYMFPSYLWISIAMLIIIISIIFGIKKKKIYIALNVIIIFISYMASLIVILPIQNFSTAIRVIYVLGQSISAILIYIYCNNFQKEKNNMYENIIQTIIVFYFIMNVIFIVKNTYDSKFANILDQQFAQKIENEIEMLEEQGNHVEAIGIDYTGNGENIKKYNQLTQKDSLYLNGIYTMNLHKFYTHRTISRTPDFPGELKETYFENPSEEEVQMKYINNILYILIDL